MANAFFVRCDCRNRRFTGGKSRFLQEADGRKGIASAADELRGSALNQILRTKKPPPCKNTQNGGKKRTQTHLLYCQPKFTPLFIQKGTKNGDLKTGNVSPRTASVRGAWRNPTFCCVYCDLCPRTIAFLSLQILSGNRMGFPRFAVIITDVFCGVKP